MESEQVVKECVEHEDTDCFGFTNEGDRGFWQRIFSNRESLCDLNIAFWQRVSRLLLDVCGQSLQQICVTRCSIRVLV